MLKKFVASPFSGYLAIALLLACAGAAYWFWTELKEFGGLEQRAVAQEQAIANQAHELATMRGIIERKDAALAAEVEDKAKLLAVAHTMKGMIHDARAVASKALKECMDMHVADGMRFGPSRDNTDGADKAGSNVDG